MTEAGAVVAAVATPPAMIAPARNAPMTFVGLLILICFICLIIFILTILYLDAEKTL
jgi:hypothetical protein